MLNFYITFKSGQREREREKGDGARLMNSHSSPGTAIERQIGFTCLTVHSLHLLIFMTKFRTHPLDLHEIRSIVARNLGLQGLASCARVSQEWNDSFTPRLYHSIVLSEHGPPIESVNRNKHHIRHLEIDASACEKLPSTGTRGKMVSTILANSALITLNLWGNSIRDIGAQALAEALKTNKTCGVKH